jgi:putative ABC transport system permease protein
MRLLMRRMIRSQRKLGFVGVLFAALVILTTSLSIAMAEHSRNGTKTLGNFYSDSNLADLTVEALPGWNYNESELLAACDELIDNRSDLPLQIATCDSRFIHDESFIKKDGESIPMRAHGYNFNRVEGVSNTWQDPSEDWGRMPNGSDEVAIDMHVREQLDIVIGDDIEVVLNGELRNFTVVGYGFHPNHLYYIGSKEQLVPGDGVYAVIFLNVETLTTALGQPVTSRTTLLIDVAGTPEYDLQDTVEIEGAELIELTSIVSDTLNNIGVKNVRVEDRSSIYPVEILRQDLEGNAKILPFFVLVLGGISAIVIAVSLDRLVRRQSREIAVMRTIGVRGDQILLSYLSVPLIFGGAAATLGIPIGRYLSEQMTIWYFEGIVGVPVTRIDHYPEMILPIWGGVMAILFIFGLAPALRAMSLTPLEVMRRQANAQAGVVIQKLTSRLSPTLSLGMRATFRRPGRLMTTIFGLGLALMILGGTLMLWVAMFELFEDSREADSWQMSAGFYPLNDQGIRTWVDEHPEYEAEWSLVIPINLSGDPKTLTLHSMNGFSSDAVSTMHATKLVMGRLPIENSSVTEAVVDQGVFEILGLELDKEFEFVIGTEPMSFRIVGVVSEMERSMWAYHSDVTSELEEIGITVHNLVYLRDGPSATISVTEIESLTAVEGVTLIDRAQMKEAFDQALDQQSGFMYIFLVVGAAIAILVLLNTLMINLTEHDHEFATLRILGASSRKIGTILTMEHITIGLLGGIAGAIAAAFMALGLTSMLRTWAFFMPVVIDPVVSFFIVAFILVSAILVTPFGVARLRRMDLIEHAQSLE